MAVFAVIGVAYTIALLSLSSRVGFGVGVFLLAAGGGGAYGVYYNLVARTTIAEGQASTAAAVTVAMSLGGALFPVIAFAVLNSSAPIVDGVHVYTSHLMRIAFAMPVLLALVMIAIAAGLVIYQRRHGGQLLTAGETRQAESAAAQAPVN